MKRLNKYRWILIGIIWLVACYIVGQALNGDKIREKQASENELPAPEIAHAKISEYDKNGDRIEGASNSERVAATDNLGKYAVSFDGVQSTEDNPWGKNAGIINVDEYGDCALITPNTALVIYDLSEKAKINLKAEIHPWMSDSSDGAGIVLQYISDSGEIIEEKPYSDIIKDKADLIIDNSIGANIIKVLCNNGSNNDDSGDWLIIWEN